MSFYSTQRTQADRRARRFAAAGSILALSLAFAATARAADSWPTKGHDARRTAQINVSGPATPKSVAVARIDQGGAINVAATVATDGTTFFGTWGFR